jgi:hypothetical protein
VTLLFEASRSFRIQELGDSGVTDLQELQGLLAPQEQPALLLLHLLEQKLPMRTERPHCCGFCDFCDGLGDSYVHRDGGGASPYEPQEPWTRYPPLQPSESLCQSRRSQSWFHLLRQPGKPSQT